MVMVGMWSDFSTCTNLIIINIIYNTYYYIIKNIEKNHADGGAGDRPITNRLINTCLKIHYKIHGILPLVV